jgi:hypothetical protein
VSEQELETTEGECVDLLAELLELAGWTQFNDKETGQRRRRTWLDYRLDDCLINCVQHSMCFLINIVEP